jgi:hypothetical protein
MLHITCTKIKQRTRGEDKLSSASASASASARVCSSVDDQ